jgi:hypothetical protein
MLELARAAAVTPAVLALLEGRALALPRGDATDVAILYAAIGLENEAIALYELGIKQRLFPAGLRARAAEFRGDHFGHRDTQVALIEERGGQAPAPIPSYEFGRLEAGDAVIRQALRVEVAAQDAYAALIAQIREKDYLLSAGFILVDEVRHMTVWRHVLGMKVY